MKDPENLNEVLIGGIENVAIVIEDYNPTWPVRFDWHARRIHAALGDRALQIEHIGSTSVPQLAAKPIVDMLLVVADSSDEASYLPALEKAGYQLRVREPKEQEHRMVRTPERDVHVHIYTCGCPAIDRYLLFRDRLRASADDSAQYELVKRALARQTWSDMNAYADAKSEIVERIIASAIQEGT